MRRHRSRQPLVGMALGTLAVLLIRSAVRPPVDVVVLRLGGPRLGAATTHSGPT